MVLEIMLESLPAVVLLHGVLADTRIYVDLVGFEADVDAGVMDVDDDVVGGQFQLQ